MPIVDKIRGALARAPDLEAILRRKPLETEPAHICHLVEDLEEESGVARVVLELSNALDPSKLLVSVLSIGRHGSLFQRLEPRVQAFALFEGGRVSPRLVRRAAEILSRTRVDLLHTHDTHAGVLGLLAARIARVGCLVHTAHDLSGATPKQLAAMRLGARSFDRLVAVSLATAARLGETLRIPKSGIRVIRNGIDLERTRPLGAREASRRELGLSEEELVIGSVGALRPVKNHGLLLEAAALLRRAGSPAKVLLAGTGPEEVQLRERARALEVSLLLPGRQREIARTLAALDLFVLPSLEEGCSLTLMEAMACGLAVVASNVGGNPELVKDEQNGLLFETGSADGLAAALSRLARDPALRQTLGQNARGHAAASFGLVAPVQATADLYRNVLYDRWPRTSAASLERVW
jgi:L-malate glycosyltransferase